MVSHIADNAGIFPSNGVVRRIVGTSVVHQAGLDTLVEGNSVRLGASDQVDGIAVRGNGGPQKGGAVSTDIAVINGGTLKHGLGPGASTLLGAHIDKQASGTVVGNHDFAIVTQGSHCRPTSAG